MKIINVIDVNLKLIVNGVQQEAGFMIGVLLLVNQKAIVRQRQ